MDEERDSSDKMEVQEQGEEVCSLIKNCMFSMKMKMVESARKQVGLWSSIVAQNFLKLAVF